MGLHWTRQNASWLIKSSTRVQNVAIGPSQFLDPTDPETTEIFKKDSCTKKHTAPLIPLREFGLWNVQYSTLYGWSIFAVVESSLPSLYYFKSGFVMVSHITAVVNTFCFPHQPNPSYSHSLAVIVLPWHFYFSFACFVSFRLSSFFNTTVLHPSALRYFSFYSSLTSWFVCIFCANIHTSRTLEDASGISSKIPTFLCFLLPPTFFLVFVLPFV